MEKVISNVDVEINSDLFSTQKILSPELYDIKVPIELKCEKPLNGKQYLLAIPITKFFSNLRNLYLLIHILNGDSVISLRLIEYFVVNYVLDNNTYFNVKKYNKNNQFAVEHLFNKTHSTDIKEEIREDILSRQNSNSLLDLEDYNNFDDFFMIHDNYKCQLKACNKKNFDPFCRSTRIRFYYSKQKYFYTTIAQLNFFKWMIENYIVDYLLDNLPTIEKSMITYEKKVKNDKLIRNKSDILEVSEYFDEVLNTSNNDIKQNNNTKSKNISSNQHNQLNNTQKNIKLDSNSINLELDSSINLEELGLKETKISNILTTNKLKNSKTKKKEYYNSNSDKKTKLKGRTKKEFTKTNRSILKYNCSKVVSFD
jgi:hypothetical protein